MGVVISQSFTQFVGHIHEQSGAFSITSQVEMGGSLKLFAVGAFSISICIPMYHHWFCTTETRVLFCQPLFVHLWFVMQCYIQSSPIHHVKGFLTPAKPTMFDPYAISITSSQRCCVECLRILPASLATSDVGLTPLMNMVALLQGSTCLPIGVAQGSNV